LTAPVAPVAPATAATARNLRRSSFGAELLLEFLAGIPASLGAIVFGLAARSQSKSVSVYTVTLIREMGFEGHFAQQQFSEA
jgi:hypothetical protein